MGSKLSPGHFLIGKPLAALPDPSFSYKSVSLLHRWHPCRNLVRHFWHNGARSSCLISTSTTNGVTRNVTVGDVVLLQESGMVPTKQPLGQVIDTHPGKDNLVRVITVKTSQGCYKRRVSNVAVLCLTIEFGLWTKTHTIIIQLCYARGLR